MNTYEVVILGVKINFKTGLAVGWTHDKVTYLRRMTDYPYHVGPVWTVFTLKRASMEHSDEVWTVKKVGPVWSDILEKEWSKTFPTNHVPERVPLTITPPPTTPLPLKTIDRCSSCEDWIKYCMCNLPPKGFY